MAGPVPNVGCIDCIYQAEGSLIQVQWAKALRTHFQRGEKRHLCEQPRQIGASAFSILTLEIELGRERLGLLGAPNRIGRLFKKARKKVIKAWSQWRKASKPRQKWTNGQVPHG